MEVYEDRYIGFYNLEYVRKYRRGIDNDQIPSIMDRFTAEYNIEVSYKGICAVCLLYKETLCLELSIHIFLMFFLEEW